MILKYILIKKMNKPVSLLLLLSSHLPLFFIVVLLLCLVLGPPENKYFVFVYFFMGFAAMASLLIGLFYFTKSVWHDNGLLLSQKIWRLFILYFISPFGIVFLYWDKIARYLNLSD